MIATDVNDLKTHAPDSFRFITGDFNHCLLKNPLPRIPATCHMRHMKRQNTRRVPLQGKGRTHIRCLTGAGSQWPDRKNHAQPRSFRVALPTARAAAAVCGENSGGLDEEVGVVQLQGCSECTDWNVFADHRPTYLNCLSGKRAKQDRYIYIRTHSDLNLMTDTQKWQIQDSSK